MNCCSLSFLFIRFPVLHFCLMAGAICYTQQVAIWWWFSSTFLVPSLPGRKFDVGMSCHTIRVLLRLTLIWTRKKYLFIFLHFLVVIMKPTWISTLPFFLNFFVKIHHLLLLSLGKVANLYFFLRSPLVPGSGWLSLALDHWHWQSNPRTESVIVNYKWQLHRIHNRYS